MKPTCTCPDGPDSKREDRSRMVGRGGRVKDLPVSLRPREDLEKRGAANLSDEQLLAILIRTGMRGVNAMDLARLLLCHYETLGRLANADWRELVSLKLPGLGRVKAMELEATLEIGRRIGSEKLRDDARSQVCEPKAVYNLLATRAGALRTEMFWALLLDTKNRLIGAPVEISSGLLDASLVHPREVFNPAVRHSAASIILAHNHPSGDPTPSAEDLRVTRQLVRAGSVMGVRVLDHVILGRTQERRPAFISLRETGLVDFKPADGLG